MSDREYVIKLIVVGPPFAGKTCMVNKFCYNKFTNEYKATLGCDFSFMKTKVKGPDGVPSKVKVQFWDIGGQELNAELTRVFYKGAAGCIIVGDLTNNNTANDIKLWYDAVKKIPNAEETGKKIVTTLFLNKVDLLTEESERRKAESLKEEMLALGINQVFLTSALTGEGTQEGLDYVLQKAAEVKIFASTKIDNTLNPEIVMPSKGCC